MSVYILIKIYVRAFVCVCVCVCGVMCVCMCIINQPLPSRPTPILFYIKKHTSFLFLCKAGLDHSTLPSHLGSTRRRTRWAVLGGTGSSLLRRRSNPGNGSISSLMGSI